MFSRLTTIASFVSLAILAVAIPNNIPPPSTCSTGPVQCCNTVEKASDEPAKSLLSEKGIVLDQDVPVGLECSPITVIGGDDSGCKANTVCCQDNSHGDWISIGCVPIAA